MSSEPRLGSLLSKSKKQDFLVKTSSREHRARARFSRFIPTPPSVMRALRSLRNATAQALYNFLIEKCFGFGQGSVELSYGQISKVIGRSWRTVARVASKLRTLGLVVVDSLPCGAYRWRIPVLAEEVKEDPHGVLLVLESSQPLADPILPIPSGYDKTVISPHDSFVISPMSDLSWGDTCEERVSIPCDIRAEALFEAVEKEAPKRHDQETCFKRHHHEVLVTAEIVKFEKGDDESVGHKNLLRKLLELGMKQRVARKLLRENDHEVVSGALERVALRGDIANPAGYVLREVEDGGYEESLTLCDFSPQGSAVASPRGEKSSDAPMVSVGVEETRSQIAAAEAEREALAVSSRAQVQALLTRFSALSDEIKEILRVRWTAVKEDMVPNTPRRAEILRDPKFEKMAFREVVSGFFARLDGGATTEGALAGT